MSDRQEPTISNLNNDPRSRETVVMPSVDSKQKVSAGNGGPRPKMPHPSSPHPSSTRPVVVKKSSNVFGLFALLIALVACAAAGYLYLQMQQSNELLQAANTRLLALEEKLTLSDDEASASLTTLQANLKEANSEIRKLWGVSYDTNRKAIAKNKADAASIKSQLEKKLKTLTSELAVTNDVLDAQQSALSKVENNSRAIINDVNAATAASTKVKKDLVTLQQRVRNTEEDIEAINGFRRSVNSQLQQLRSSTSTNVTP